ncbi:MAG TPA: hypothetical protein VHA71_00565 [Rhodanobacteraceae bacterium]|jgi:hypothetical protein|nr:hypothetical protein [Rhodanobacteraceae bacterium]
MLDIALFIVLCVLATRAFIALRRESAVRREFGQSAALDTLVLLYPLVPLWLLGGPYVLPRLLVFVLAAVFFVAALFVASRQRGVLERAGSDRVDQALAATSSATLGAIVGVIYVALVGVYAAFVYYMASHPWGA